MRGDSIPFVVRRKLPETHRMVCPSFSAASNSAWVRTSCSIDALLRSVRMACQTVASFVRQRRVVQSVPAVSWLFLSANTLFDVRPFFVVLVVVLETRFLLIRRAVLTMQASRVLGVGERAMPTEAERQLWHGGSFVSASRSARRHRASVFNNDPGLSCTCNWLIRCEHRASSSRRSVRATTGTVSIFACVFCPVRINVWVQ